MVKRSLVALLVSIGLLVGLFAVNTLGRKAEPKAPIRAPAGGGSLAHLPERAGEPSQQGALAVLGAYAEARRALDFERAYSLLTLSAQDAFSPADFAAAYRNQRAYSYRAIEVESPRGEVARGWVTDLVLTGDRVFAYARYPYTLRYEGGRWGVAQGTGLAPRVLRAFHAGHWQENLDLAQRWLEIDPHAWEPHLERYYVYKDTGRPDEAKAAWEQAYAAAPPEDLPDLHNVLSMLYALGRQGPELLASARRALDGAARLGAGNEARYDLKWRAGVVIKLAFAYRYMGDESAAERYYQEARALDPANSEVERFWRTMPAR